jgi:hypothetical protein
LLAQVVPRAGFQRHISLPWYTMQVIQRPFCSPCSRSRCRAWLCTWIRLHLCLGNASTCVLSFASWHPANPARPEAAWAGPLTVVAAKKCLGVSFAPVTAQFFEPVGREGLRRQWHLPAVARLSPVLYGTPASLPRVAVLQAAGARSLCYGSGFGHNQVCSSPGQVSSGV